MDLADLPDPVVPHVLILGDADTPFVKLPGLCGLDKNAPAAPGALAVRGDMHDRLQLHLIVEPAGLRKFGTDAAQISQHPLLADEGPASIDLVLAVVGEQVRSLRPHALVGVVAVDALQVLDIVLVAQELYFLGQRRQATGDGLQRKFGVRRSGGGGRCGRVFGRLRPIERERRQVAAGPRAVLFAGRPVGRQVVGNVFASVDVRVLRPTAGVGDDECLVPVKGLDLPDPTILHVFVDVRTFTPRGAFAELS